MVTIEAAEIRERLDHVFGPPLLPRIAPAFVSLMTNSRTLSIGSSSTHGFSVPAPAGCGAGIHSRIVVAGASAKATTQGATADPSETAALPTPSEG
jgi:hypothetical protein